MAAAQGIVSTVDRKSLAKHGGHITITNDWGRSLLRRMNFVKSKGTKDVKRLPDDFQEIKAAYNKRVQDAMTKHQIPENLVMNLDQTGCNLVPGGQWTMDEQGVNQVTICGMDGKRQITVLLTVTMAAQLLAPQVIYTGTTTGSLPRGIEFPASWDVTSTANHWSNKDSMLQYIDTVLLPYVKNNRKNPEQKALLILDVFAAHRTEVIFLPACCTDKLQPLDLTLNKDYKDELKACFHNWFAEQVQDAIERQVDETGQELDEATISTSSTSVDLRMSVINPVHAGWLIHTLINIVH